MSYPCPFCVKLFETKEHLRLHIVNKHKKGSAYIRRKIFIWKDRLVHAKKGVEKLEQKISWAEKKTNLAEPFSLDDATLLDTNDSLP